MAVGLWASHLERPLTAAETAALLPLLPPERRVRLERLRLPARRREPLCAYALLTLALAERYGWPALPEVALSPQGKPCFSAYPQVCFSLSHTEGAVLVGVSEEPVGVDIERVRPVSRRMLELEGADTAEAFFARWVRREAYAKRQGTGLGAPRSAWPSPEAEAVDTFQGYMAAVSAKGAAVPGAKIVSLEELLRFAHREKT